MSTFTALPQLPGTAVDDDQRRWIAELAALVRRKTQVAHVGAKAAGQDLLHRGKVVLAVDGPDLEPSVVGLLRQPILEDHHGGNRVSALNRGDVVALDPQRRARHPEVLLQVAQGMSPSVVVRLTFQAMPGKLLASVRLSRLHQPPLGAPLGHPQRNPPLSAVLEPVSPHLWIIGQLLHQDLAGRHLGPVELAEHHGDQLGGRHVGDSIEHGGLAPRQPSALDGEHHEDRLEVVLLERNEVEGLGSLTHQLLAGEGLLHRRQLVAHPCGPFVFECVGSSLHFEAQPGRDVFDVPIEKRGKAIDVTGVVIGAHRADARTRAPLDVEQQTRPSRSPHGG